MTLIQFLQLTCAVGGVLLIYALYLLWQSSHHATVE